MRCPGRPLGTEPGCGGAAGGKGEAGAECVARGCVVHVNGHERKRQLRKRGGTGCVQVGGSGGGGGTEVGSAEHGSTGCGVVDVGRLGLCPHELCGAGWMGVAYERSGWGGMGEEAVGAEKVTWCPAWCQTMSQAGMMNWALSAGGRGNHDWKQHGASCEGC